MYELVQITQFKVQGRLLSENKPKSLDLLTSSLYFKRVPEEGLEPSLHYWKRILSPQRLPFRHSGIGFDLLTNQLRGIEPFSLEMTDLLISSD